MAFRLFFDEKIQQSLLRRLAERDEGGQRAEGLRLLFSAEVAYGAHLYKVVYPFVKKLPKGHSSLARVEGMKAAKHQAEK